MYRFFGLFDIVSPNGSKATSTGFDSKTGGHGQLQKRASQRKKLQVYTIEEVEAANTEKKPWIAVRGKVFDLTNFVNKHPGGKDMLLAGVGRDVTAMFESIHSEKNAKVLNKYLIGTLKGPTNVPEYREDSPFYTEVKQRIDLFFKEKGKDPRDAPQMFRTYFFLFAVFVAMYQPMFSQPKSWAWAWVPWAAAVVTGWACAMLGFYPNHDACHGAITRSPLVWNICRRVYESITGLNTLLWIYQHGIGHHPFTNVVGADPDIIAEDPGLLRMHKEQPWWNYYGWQKYYWLPMYSQMVLSRKLTEYKSVFYDNQFKHIKINPPVASEWFWSAVVLTVYSVHHFVVPLAFFKISILRLIALHTVSDLVWSLYLALIFQASHVNNDVAWPNPDKASPENWKENDWAALQIEASLDFAHGDWWTTFLCGSLNYQAIHHLFPYVCQWYYPEMAPIVIKCCEEYGVKYNHRPSIWAMIRCHVERILMFGQEEIVLR